MEHHEGSVSMVYFIIVRLAFCYELGIMWAAHAHKGSLPWLGFERRVSTHVYKPSDLPLWYPTILCSKGAFSLHFGGKTSVSSIRAPDQVKKRPNSPDKDDITGTVSMEKGVTAITYTGDTVLYFKKMIAVFLSAQILINYLPSIHLQCS